MTEPVVIAKASGLEVLASLAPRIGFQPTNSVVLVGIQPPNGRLGVTMRLDLDLIAAAPATEWLDRHLAPLVLSEAAAVFVARFGRPGHRLDGNDRAFWDFIAAVEHHLPVLECWDATDGSYGEFDPAKHQPVGPVFDLADLQSTRTAAAYVSQGVRARESRDQLGRIELAPPAKRKLTLAAQRRAEDRALLLADHEYCQWLVRGLETWQVAHHRLTEQPGTAIEPPALGRIAALITRAHGRDAVLATAFISPPGTATRILLGLGGKDETLNPLASPGVDEDLCLAALDLIRQLLSHQMPSRRGPGYTLGAAWYWWLGDGAAADVWATAALETDSPPQLAALVSALLRHGIFPGAVTSAGC
ncbi:MAG: DUF4192 domain-containing protein [Bifidobacteriaceae bacterium]|jgi:hypothetical protein|nr:DUF4192 domain-containing protein [Bifidobacteriaceae bacterium]